MPYWRRGKSPHHTPRPMVAPLEKPPPPVGGRIRLVSMPSDGGTPRIRSMTGRERR